MADEGKALNKVGPGLAGGALALAWLWASFMLLACLEPLWDEANQLSQAWRVAQGAHLYREVWEFAGPLPLEFMGWVFGATGPSLDVARGVAALGLGLTMMVMVGLLRAVKSPWPVVMLAASLVPLGVQPAYRGFYHHGFTWVLVLSAWGLAVSKPSPSWRPWLLWGAGLGLGLAWWSTLSIGALGALAVGGAWCWGALFPGTGSRDWRTAWLLLAGWVTGLVLVWVAFVWQGSGSALWELTWAWPLANYRQSGGINDVWPLSDLATSLPFDSHPGRAWRWLLSTLARLGVASLHAVGFLVALAGLSWGAWKAWRGEVPPPWPWRLATLGSLGTGPMIWHGRADLTHMAMGALPAVWLLGGVAGEAWRVGASAVPRHPAGRWFGAAPSLALAFVVLLCVGAELRQAASQASLGQLSWGLDARIRAMPWARWVQAEVPPGTRVLALPYQGWLFLLTQVQPATSFGYLAPEAHRYHGPVERARWQRELAAHPPDLVWLAGGQPELGWSPWDASWPPLQRTHQPLVRLSGLGGGVVWARRGWHPRGTLR